MVVIYSLRRAGLTSKLKLENVRVCHYCSACFFAIAVTCDYCESRFSSIKMGRAQDFFGEVILMLRKSIFVFALAEFAKTVIFNFISILAVDVHCVQHRRRMLALKLANIY